MFLVSNAHWQIKKNGINQKNYIDQNYHGMSNLELTTIIGVKSVVSNSYIGKPFEEWDYENLIGNVLSLG